MWNEPDARQLSAIPKLYETEEVRLRDKLIYLHFFIGGCDWYITEFNGEDMFLGFAILNNDFQNAEWGYISYRELKAINLSGFEIDCELDWNPCKASTIEKICMAHSWKDHD